MKFVSISDSEQDTVAAAAREWVDLYEDDGSLNWERLEAALDAYRNPHSQRAKGRAATPEDRIEAAVLAFLQEGK